MAEHWPDRTFDESVTEARPPCLEHGVPHSFRAVTNCTAFAGTAALSAEVSRLATPQLRLHLYHFSPARRMRFLVLLCLPISIIEALSYISIKYSRNHGFRRSSIRPLVQLSQHSRRQARWHQDHPTWHQPRHRQGQPRGSRCHQRGR